jgi:hypothetical protein
MILCWTLFDEHFRLRFAHRKNDYKMLFVHEARRRVAVAIHQCEQGIIEFVDTYILYKRLDSVIAICTATHQEQDYMLFYKWTINIPMTLGVSHVNSFDLIHNSAILTLYTELGKTRDDFKNVASEINKYTIKYR